MISKTTENRKCRYGHKNLKNLWSYDSVKLPAANPAF